jgi:fucose 4-O-acetylase-like acetyltransferase
MNTATQTQANDQASETVQPNELDGHSNTTRYVGLFFIWTTMYLITAIVIVGTVFLGTLLAAMIGNVLAAVIMSLLGIGTFKYVLEASDWIAGYVGKGVLKVATWFSDKTKNLFKKKEETQAVPAAV